ncbi:MAG: glycosyltransferase family 2 protein [Boseongicola sp.]
MSEATYIPAFSVIVASYQRADWLRRCLTALWQLDYPIFEIIVAADNAGLIAMSSHPVATHCKTVRCDDANIAATRNAGLALAAGEYVAFIDDDAVPEPYWLRHHADALARTGAAASVGYVRGRNGISFQSRTESVDAEAETHSELQLDDNPFLPTLAPGRALKLVGTNAVLKRTLLSSLGGFDTAFRYYLDDADLSFRLMMTGNAAAVAPMAEVHHAFAASDRRTKLRRPSCIFDIGRSTAVYLRRHPGADHAEIFARIKLREANRLCGHMVRGTCEPREVKRLLLELESGWEEGLSVDLPTIAAMPQSRPPDFRPVPAAAPGHRVLTSRLLQRKKRLVQAEELVANGDRVTSISLSLTPVRHHLRYLDSGVWSQTGGQFGRSVRTGPRFRWCRFAKRVKEEIRRVEKQRGIDET